MVSSSVLRSHSRTLFLVLTPCKTYTPKSGFSYATSAPFLSLWPVLQFISLDPVFQSMYQAWGHLGIRVAYVHTLPFAPGGPAFPGNPWSPISPAKRLFLCACYKLTRGGCHRSLGNRALAFTETKPSQSDSFFQHNLLFYLTPFFFFSVVALLHWYCHLKS